MNKIKDYVNDCGVYLTHQNPEATDREVEFLVECVVQTCLRLVNNSQSKEEALEKISEYFIE